MTAVWPKTSIWLVAAAANRSCRGQLGSARGCRGQPWLPGPAPGCCGQLGSARGCPSFIAMSENSPLLIATDCSGLGSPLCTLRRMGLRYRHLWASDIDKGARSMLHQHCKPERIFRSIYSHHSERLPTPDVYIVGFPCQPFSGAGQRHGFDCLGGRIFFEVLDVIKKTKPRAFLLENVVGLETIGNGECIKIILRLLRKLSTHNIYHQVLNTKDHGIPHNRPRCFFRGHSEGE
jgi:DNA (cytosine-5)-methyltransferase 1